MIVLSKYILVIESPTVDKVNDIGLVSTGTTAKNERYREGVVHDKGPLVEGNIPVGSTIVFDIAKGHSVVINSVNYRVIQEQDVAVVL